jgi:hypothetical protein
MDHLACPIGHVVLSAPCEFKRMCETGSEGEQPRRLPASFTAC